MISWKEFVEHAEKKFAFLHLDYGFTETSRETPFLDYQRGDLRVSLYFKPSGRGELDLLIRNRPSLSEEWAPAKRLSHFPTSTPPDAFPSRPGEEFCATLEEVENRLGVMAQKLQHLCKSGVLFETFENM